MFQIYGLLTRNSSFTTVPSSYPTFNMWFGSSWVFDIPDVYDTWESGKM